MLEEGKLAAERIVLKRESTFFSSHQPSLAHVGILTTGAVTALMQRYPRVIEGLKTVYGQMETSTASSKEDNGNTAQDMFIKWYIDQSTRAGRLMSDGEINRITRDIKNGDYSKQIDSWYEEVERAKQPSSESETRMPAMLSLFMEPQREYRIGNSKTDIVHNKRKILSHWLAVQTHMQAVYGNVDFQNTLLTELILEAPFLEAITTDTQSDDVARKRHQSYLDETLEFVGRFHPVESMRVFEDYTADYEAPWTSEEGSVQINPFDRSYLMKLSAFAEEMRTGNWNLDDLYSLLSQTVLTRGRIFNAEVVGRQILMTPVELPYVSFDDLGGYRNQKSFYVSLLEKTAKSDSILDTLTMMLAIGKPGLGKSLGVDAFLSNLPENARGIKIKYSRSLTDKGIMPEYKALIKLAKLHPHLQVFSILEDIDTIAGDRLESPMTSQFLEMDSAAEEQSASNLHFIATTNRPDVIDPAVVRPGRTTKILVYKEPEAIEERKEIAQIHARKYTINLSEVALATIAKKSDGLTPDEIGNIVWALKFSDTTDPSDEDINKIINETKLRQELEQTVRKASKRKRV